MEKQSSFVRIIFDGTQICCFCKEQIFNEGKYLQCGHYIHNECLNKKIKIKFDDTMNLIVINKNYIWNDLDENEEHNKMYFGSKECDGIIECDTCNTSYSILSPIYRKFGIPKRIEKIILFKNKNKIISYYICTILDMIHLINPNLQHDLLKNFDFNEEEKHNDLAYDAELEKENEIIFKSFHNKELNKISFQECEFNKPKNKNCMSLDDYVNFLINVL